VVGKVLRGSEGNERENSMGKDVAETDAVEWLKKERSLLRAGRRNDRGKSWDMINPDGGARKK